MATTNTATSSTGVFNMDSTLTEGTLVGGGIGAVAGLVLGRKYGGTIWFTTLAGFVAGAFVTRVAISYYSK
jgi:uncharacterized membrane protein YebE (DUF533 family)